MVERVTFHNPETGFCVLRVKVRGRRDLVTVVGHAAMISAGEFVQASGSWVSDRTHGVQFKAAFLRAAPPTMLEGIERYLGSGMIKGIGPVYARKVVGALGASASATAQTPAGMDGCGGPKPPRVIGTLCPRVNRRCAGSDEVPRSCPPRWSRRAASASGPLSLPRTA